MNYVNSMSLRARLNNLAKKEGISPQLALQSFFAERFLARIGRSRYSRNLVIKGGTLMCAILGLRQRTTMDIDTTAVGLRVDAEVIAQIVNEIAAIDVGDGILFRRDSASPASITKDDEYGGLQYWADSRIWHD